MCLFLLNKNVIHVILKERNDPDPSFSRATLLRLHSDCLPYLSHPPRIFLECCVRVTSSDTTNFRSVTGGVYKARELIHRSVADKRLELHRNEHAKDRLTWRYSHLPRVHHWHYKYDERAKCKSKLRPQWPRRPQ